MNCLRNWWSAVWSGSTICLRRPNQFCKPIFRLNPLIYSTHLCLSPVKMTTNKMNKYFEQLRQQGVRFANKINKHTRGWDRILVSAAKETLKPETASSLQRLPTLPSSPFFQSPLAFPLPVSALGLTMDSSLSFKGWSLLRQPWVGCWGKILMKLSKRADPRLASLSGSDLVCLYSFYIHPHMNEIWVLKAPRGLEVARLGPFCPDLC